MLLKPLNRTPVSALLTALLAAVYAGIVLILGEGVGQHQHQAAELGGSPATP